MREGRHLLQATCRFYAREGCPNRAMGHRLELVWAIRVPELRVMRRGKVRGFDLRTNLNRVPTLSYLEKK
jgi:hypothetical protein